MHRHALITTIAGIVLAVAPGAAATAPDQGRGVFSAPFAEDPTFDARPPVTNEESKRIPTAVHVAMMPDGRVVYWGGLESAEDIVAPAPLDYGRAITPARSRILDLRSGAPQWSVPVNGTGGPLEDEDLFCVDQRLLSDGRLLAVGGSIWTSDPVDLGPLTGEGGPGGTAELFGSDAARWLDSRSERPAWTGADENRMHRRRWYPSLLTLADGRALVASGVERLIYNVPGVEGGRAENVRELETFDPVTNRWTREPQSADISLPLYPRLHLTHDGKVLYAASGIMWSPFGQTPDEALWNLHKVYDPERGRWTFAGISPVGARSDPLSVPLMLAPPYTRTRILVAGGTLGVSPGSYLGTDLSEVLTYRYGRTSSELTGRLNNRRWFSSGVLLPDGDVLALAGGDKNANVGLGTDMPVHQAELFDADSGRWRPLASATRDRTYHSSAILLPDGRVLLGGHAPQPVGQQDHAPSQAGLAASNLKDPSFEIFTPPYLDPALGPRPVLRRAPAGMRFGSTAVVEADGDVARLVLMRLPSATHVMDSDQRGVELEFEQEGAGALRASVPADGGVAPPGFYYLFAVSSAGVPSKARVVRVGSDGLPTGAAPAPFGA